jgi:hypothetical protein
MHADDVWLEFVHWKTSEQLESNHNRRRLCTVARKASTVIFMLLQVVAERITPAVSAKLKHEAHIPRCT